MTTAVAAKTMLLADILQLNSTDFIYNKVGEILDRVDVDTDFYRAIKERMRETGINLVPVLVNDDWLNNGHHRVKLAYELGLLEMAVTDRSDKSGFGMYEVL